MKHIHWIKQYHNEQNQIHMPNLCREKILNEIAQDAMPETESETKWEPIHTSVQRHRWKRAVQALIVLILTGFAVTLAIGSLKPASNVMEVQELKIPVETIPENESILEETTVDDEPNVTKSLILYKCLNTIQYLDQLSGTVTSRNGCQSETITSGSFAFDFDQEQYYAVVNYLDAADPDKMLSTNTYYNNNGLLVSLYDAYEDQEHTFNIQPDGPSMQGSWDTRYCSLSDEEIAAMDENDILNMDLYSDPTGSHELAICFLPQEMTIGFLSDFQNWEISGVFEENSTEQFPDRTIVQITGTADSEYSSKLGVCTFSILVDLETGIWLQYEGYDAEGTIQDYIYTENIQFYDGVEQITVPEYSAELAEEIAAEYTYVESLTSEEQEASEEADRHKEEAVRKEEEMKELQLEIAESKVTAAAED